MAAGEARTTAAGTAAWRPSFLASCAGSDDEAHGGASRAVLDRLQGSRPPPRAPTRGASSAPSVDPAAGQEEEECFRAVNLRIHDAVLDAHLQGSHRRKKLTMMEIPSAFIPGDLFVTLYVGINHHPDPDSIFRNKTVAQLGCGNGWITIALAEKWCPSKVYGLDINPRVIKIEWINLYLNALEDDGLPIYDREGKTLLGRVEFHESDLFSVETTR